MTADPWCKVCGDAPCIHGEQSDAELMELSALRAKVQELTEDLETQRLRANIAELVTGGVVAELRGIKEVGLHVLAAFGNGDVKALRTALTILHQRCAR